MCHSLTPGGEGGQGEGRGERGPGSKFVDIDCQVCCQRLKSNIIYIKNLKSVLSGYPNIEKWVENMRGSQVS